MTTFAIPTLITNVIAAFKAASSLSTATIFDGTEIDESFPNNFIAVGHDGSEGLSKMRIADSRNEYETFGEGHSEYGVLYCFLVAQDGISTLAQLRATAYTLLGAVDTVIRTDSTFTGAVQKSWLETTSPGYRQTNQGGAVDINFTIAYKAST